MKLHSTLPLLAGLAALTLMAPASAQDMSAFLNPHALAHQLDIDHRFPTGPRLPSAERLSYVVEGPAVATVLAAPERVEITRVVPDTVEIVRVPDRAEALADLIEEMADAAPRGANTAVIITDAPRLTLWQRLFGL